jgi:choice-of-anchor A domain-containing protein
LKIGQVVVGSAVALIIANSAAAAVIGGGGGGGTSTGICGGSGLEGPAEGYNVFIVGRGDFVSADSSTAGNLAVGGNTQLTNYSVASGIAGSSASAVNPATLVVGGRLSAEGGGVGSNLDGAIYTATAPWLKNFTATGGTFEQTLVDFDTATNYYQELSATLASETVTGTTTFTPATSDATAATLTFTGSVAAGLNVFSVDSAELAAAGSITISAPAGSAVIINVTGSFANFRKGSVVETGVSDAAVIYNFYQAAQITLAGSEDLEGSLLAPFAQVTAESGQLHGQVVAASFYGKMQFENAPFACTLPTPAATGTTGSGSSGQGCDGKDGKNGKDGKYGR